MPILIPQHLNFETLADVLHSTNADVLIAPAGTVPAEHLAMSCPKVKQAIWVVEETSRHMDFGVNPSKTQTAIEWHEIVADVDLNSNASSDLPSTGKVPNIIYIYQKKKPMTFDVVEFSQKVSLVFGIAVGPQRTHNCKSRISLRQLQHRFLLSQEITKSNLLIY